MTQLQKSIWYSILNQYLVIVVGFVSIAILARLLTPEEIGIFAIASSIAFIASSIRSLGVGEYLVREKDITSGKVKSVIGVMVVISWTLGFFLLASAATIAEFYDVADLRNILWILSIPFFLAPYTSIPYALFARSLKFDSILRVDLAGSLISAGFSIGLVYLGYSYYGLAWGTLLGVVAEFTMITFLRPEHMSWIPSFSEFKRILKAGFLISIGRTIAMTSQNSNDLILGRMASLSDVGFYSRGLGLITFIQNLLINSVGPTVLPHLSEVNRSGGNVAEAYLNALTLIGAFTFPVFAVVNLSAGSMIFALFGNQWGNSVSIASTLALWAMLQSIHCFSNPALLAIGKEKVVLFKEAASIVVKITLIIITVPHGLDWVAWGFVASGLFDLVMVSLIIKATHGITLAQLAISYRSNLLVAACCWISLKIMSLYIPFYEMNPLLALLIIAFAMTLVWLLALKLTGNKAWPHVRDLAMYLVTRVLMRG